MESRREELLRLQSHIAEIDTELTTIFESLQWDKQHLLEETPKVICKYDNNHRVPQGNKESHEMQCRLYHNNYSKEDKMLPDPLDANAKTLIRLNNDDITQIINQAANADPKFKRENVEIEPQTLDRLQSTYTGDERQAIYDAVVQAAPFCHDLSDLALLSEQGQEDPSKKQKSRLEILAELRDMKRRRSKYRVAAKTRNYFDVLRDVIKIQMEVYSDVKVEQTPTKSDEKWNDVVKLESNDSQKPYSSNESFKASREYREHNSKKRSRYDEDRPSSSKKIKSYDETDSCMAKYRDHRDKKSYHKIEERDHKYDYKRDSDRVSSRGSSRHKDRYSYEKTYDKIREHGSHKNYDDKRSLRDSKSHGKGHVEKHRTEKHSSSRSRDQKEEKYESKRYYSYDNESKKDKKKYSEYRK